MRRSIIKRKLRQRGSLAAKVTYSINVLGEPQLNHSASETSKIPASDHHIVHGTVY
jgi:hypothetical protein